MLGVLRQGTRIKGIEDWNFPIENFDKYQEEIVNKAQKKIEKVPRVEKKKSRKAKAQIEEFNITELDNLKIQCEMNDFLKDEDILQDIDVITQFNYRR